nr:salicylic acid methyltransferase [Primula forbesii]
MEVVTKMPYMNGGNGETSYAQNSSLQKSVISVTKFIREEAIMDLLLSTNTKTLHIADLGCSSGPNAFLVVSEVIQTSYSVSQKLKQDVPEFQVYLNDLPDTDFNTIFKSVGNFEEELKKMLGSGLDTCFVNGVPGSFYGRLFPSKSLHFVHSSYSLMWLSQAPVGLESNKGNIYRTSASPTQVLKAYYDQFQNDFSLFLKCRSEELVPGGRMVLTFRGRKSEDSASKECCYHWTLFALGLNEMVAQGIIEHEKLDSFNIPEYTPCPSEVKHLVEKDGSFTINSLNLTQVPWTGGANTEELHDPNYSSSYVTKYMRPVAEPLLASHFGESIIEEAFKKFRENLVDCYAKEAPQFYNVTVSMTRK